MDNNLASAIQCISFLTSVKDFLLDIRFLSGIAITLIGFYIFIFKKEIRLSRNLKKEIYFLKTDPSQYLDTEIERLKANKLFNVHQTAIDISKNIRNLETKDNAFLVLAYNNRYSSVKYEKVLEYSFNKKIPLICYSKEDITNKIHKKMFKDHPYTDICNTPTRLISTIFNIAAVTPNEKK